MITLLHLGGRRGFGEVHGERREDRVRFSEGLCQLTSLRGLKSRVKISLCSRWGCYGGAGWILNGELGLRGGCTEDLVGWRGLG